VADTQKSLPYPVQGEKNGDIMAEASDIALHNDSVQANTPIWGMQKNSVPGKLINVLFYVWLSGVVAILAIYIAGNVLFLVKINRSPVIVHEEISSILNALYKEMGIRKKIRIIELHSVKSPAIYGFYKPVILVSNIDFLMHLEKEKLKLLLMHELQHYKSWDNLIKIIGTFLKALHWFNPFIWLAFRKISIIQEYVCDEEVVNLLEKDEQGQYANLIFDVYELLIPVSPFLRKPSFIKLRIQKILGKDESRPMKLNFQVALILLFIFCTFQITNVLAKEPIQQLSAVLGEKQTVADLYVRSVPDGVDGDFNLSDRREPDRREPEKHAASPEAEPETPMRTVTETDKVSSSKEMQQVSKGPEAGTPTAAMTETDKESSLKEIQQTLKSHDSGNPMRAIAVAETEKATSTKEMQQFSQDPSGNTLEKYSWLVEVSFRDKAFEDFVRKFINKSEGPIYDTDLKHIKQLVIIGNTLITKENLVLDDNFNQIGYTAENGLFYHFSQCDKQGEISSLEDLRLFPGLETLTIRHNRLKTVSGVEYLISIRNLDLAFNQINDLKGLDLIDHDMKYINLSSNRISDITPLDKLPPIEDHLDLSYNNITDIKTLGKISVPSTNLSGNPVMNNSAVFIDPDSGHIILKP
jgi:beta-lactamase regulating signal transducer with metallopeptidase domain